MKLTLRNWFKAQRWSLFYSPSVSVLYYAELARQRYINSSEFKKLESLATENNISDK